MDQETFAIKSLPFDAVACTGFEDDHSPKNLCEQQTAAPRSHSCGWLTPRFSLFPQCVVFRMKSGLCRIRQIQLVCNERCIPSEVNFYVGEKKPMDDQAEIRFHKIGFFQIPMATQKTVEGRLLHMVHVDIEAEYLKVELCSCHLSLDNLYNQAGLVRLSCIGSVINHDERAKLWAGDPQTRRLYGLEDAAIYPRLDPANAAVYGLVNQLGSLPASANQSLTASASDKEMHDLMAALERQKIMAVQEENYADAGRLKKLLIYLYDVSAQVAKLHLAKVTAAQEENFEVAENLRSTVVEIKKAMWRHICSQHYSVYRSLKLGNSIPSAYLPKEEPSCAVEKSARGSEGCETVPTKFVADGDASAVQNIPVNSEPKTGDATEAKVAATPQKFYTTKPATPTDQSREENGGAKDGSSRQSDNVFKSLERLNKSLEDAVSKNGLNAEGRSTLPKNVNLKISIRATEASSSEVSENLIGETGDTESVRSPPVAKKVVVDSGIDYDSISDPFKSSKISEDTPLRRPVF